MARTLTAWLAYPLVVFGGIVLHLLAASSDAPPLASAYVAVVLGAIAITALEAVQPYRPSWRGELADVKTDVSYLVTVQAVLPTLLGIGVALTLARSTGIGPSRLWPHGSPVWVQAILMLFGADFLRYWLHRAAHRFEPLWRLHAVHHSPEKLYWLNVGRFHPLEKALQYFLDALPFVLLGVGEDVLALYFVFYALNGFFQHSNIDLRFGIFNYVVSSAELHRWHHSKEPKESDTNFGNNIIVWDWLFGTRFLPREREVAELGLLNPAYPRSLGAQLRAPFIPGMDQKESPLLGWKDLATNTLLRLRMWLVALTAWRSLARASRNPMEFQRRLLRRIVRRNRTSVFGSEHGFSEVESYQDYRARVPITEYESHRPYAIAGQLTADTPVLYSRTSGTTGAPKLIPVTRRSFRRLRCEQAVASCALYRSHPRAFDGRFLTIVSPAIEGSLESGVPYGSASGQLHASMPAAARAKHVVPPEVFEIEDYELKYLLILRLALVEKNVTLLAAANPSTLIMLASLVERYRHELLVDAESGAFWRSHELPAHVARVVRCRLKCPPFRVEELRRALSKPNPSFSALWPHLALVVTWTGGNCAIALNRLRTLLAPAVAIAELGYLASELRGTIELGAGGGLPTLESTFFEFVEAEKWDRGCRNAVTLDKLETGRDYHVIISTEAGLYRYFMNDIVRVTGRFFETPLLRFVQKGRGVTNLTGEKLYESQVVEALSGVDALFFMMLADRTTGSYRLLFEGAADSSLARVVDERLRRLNVEYDAKRASGRLGHLEVAFLKDGAGEAYKRHCISRGQREAQFKTMTLRYADELHFPYRDYLLGERARIPV